MSLIKTTDFVGQYQIAQSNSDTVLLQSFIDREETRTLYRLLGKELADLIIAYYPLTKATITTGPLVVGVRYTILTYVAGDDFTNVGGTNVTGSSFVATGTTPTVWTNASSVTNVVERFDNIINSFYLEDEADILCEHEFVYDSRGIKELLIIQIYYAYITETQLRQGQSGVAKSQAENGTVSSPVNAFRFAEIKWNVAGLETWAAIRWYCKIKYPDVYPDYKGTTENARYSSVI